MGLAEKRPRLWRRRSKMEGNERQSTEAAVPKTGACSSSATTTQPAAAFFALNFAIESTTRCQEHLR